MSEGIIVAIIGVIGSLLGAAIGAFATLQAASIKGNQSSGITCAVIGLIASITAAIGLVLGVSFGVFIVQQVNRDTTAIDREIAQDNGETTSSNEFSGNDPLPLSTPFSTMTLPAIVQRTPTSRGIIEIPVNSSEGYRFPVDISGQYIFQYIDGAYSTYPLNQAPPGQPTWLSGIAVYLNQPIQWDGTAISQSSPPDYSLGDFNYVNTESDALNAARVRSNSLTVNLSEGDYLIFVAIDEKSAYSDNPGKIRFEVFFLAE